MIKKQKTKLRLSFVAFTMITLLFSGCKDSEKTENESAADIPVSREMTAELTSPQMYPHLLEDEKLKNSL